jgi:hypothetical protein
MSIRPDQFFPSWVSANYVLLPPVVFFWALMFCLGLFFEVDFRLLMLLSFGDYLAYFTIFVMVLAFVVAGVVGLGAWLWNKGGLTSLSTWIARQETRSSSGLRWLMVITLLAGMVVSGLAGVYVRIFTGIVVFMLFLVPVVGAYMKNETVRFRASATVLVFVLAWPFNSFGTLAGRALVAGPKRVYLLKLQNGTDIYANIILYASGGIVYKANNEIYFSPYDSVVFTRRTGFRKQM